MRVCRAAASGCMLGHATSMLVLVRLYACQIRQPQIPIREPSRSSPCGTYVFRQPFRIFETCTEHIRGTSSQKRKLPKNTATVIYPCRCVDVASLEAYTSLASSPSSGLQCPDVHPLVRIRLVFFCMWSLKERNH